MQNTTQKRPISEKPKTFAQLGMRLKRQMDDIIDVAYPNYRNVKALKNFYIQCSDSEQKTMLGVCETSSETGRSLIRIVHLETEAWKEILITTMHELSHHIDFQFRKKTGHDSVFYEIHKKLLFSAFDMGILGPSDVVHSGSQARNRDKLARMMREYVPHPIAYKQSRITVCVYNCYAAKDSLKAQGFSWNALDKAWTIEMDNSEESEYRAFLANLKIPETDVKVISGGAVISRLKKNIRLRGVPYSHKEIPKNFGYNWNKEQKFWEKRLDTDTIPSEEQAAIRQIPGIEIEIL